jgi:4-amino-4-deoxy-L-arabinose transferase-like glycosyltransferase
LKTNDERQETKDGGTGFVLRPSSFAIDNHLVLLLAIFLLAFALRMARLGELRMWGDEAYSVYSAQRSLTAITFEGIENDPHPPLYYYLLHFYLLLAGSSELALRFFSVFFGVATIALLYAIGKRMFDTRVGVTAAAVAAIAPFHVYYSQEIRMYALAIFLTTLALYFFVRLVRERVVIVSGFCEALSSPTSETTSSRKSLLLRNLTALGRFMLSQHATSGREILAMTSRMFWVGYALAMLLALYSLYHTAFIFLAEGIFLLTLWKTRREFVIRWFAVAFGIVTVFLPWLFFRFSGTLGHLEDRAGRAAQTLPVFVARGFAALTVGTTIPVMQAVLFSALFFAVVASALFIAMKARDAKASDGLLLALIVIPIVAVYPLYLLLPILVGRLFALAFAPLALLIARSVVAINQRARLAAIPVALLIVASGAYALNDYYFRFDRYNAAAEDYLPVIRTVEQRAQPGDAVLFHAYWQIGYFLSHYRGALIEYRALDNQSDLSVAVAQPRNVWAIVQGLPLHGSEVWLAQHAFPVSEQKFGQMRLILYRAGVPARAEKFSTPVVYDNGIALLGYRINDAPLESGRGIVMIELDWHATRQVPEDFTVSVRLSRGETVWAQEDSQPASGTLPTSTWRANQIVQDRHGLAIPVGTPPGNYAPKIVMYQLQSGRPASIIAPENLRAQTLALGNVSIVKPAIALPPPTIPNMLDVRWDEIALAGFESGVAEIGLGDSLPLTLYWQARQKPTRAYAAWFQLIDSSGAAHPPAIHRLASDAFSTLEWDAGETWLDKVGLKIDAEAAPGEAAVKVGLIDVESGEAVMPQRVELMRLKITGRAHRFELPAPKYPLQVNLGGKIKLLGYDLDVGAVKPGTPLRLRLYWQGLDKMAERYTVFAHVLDASGALVAQKDGEPDDGLAPTTSWLPGEVIADYYQIELPNTLAAGDYALQVGMYQAASGKRLTTEAGADRAQLTKIVVAR